MDKTAVALGFCATGGIVALAYAPIDGEGQAIAFTALASLGGAAGGMVLPHAPRYNSRLRMIPPQSEPPSFTEG
jgi:hypothetical protein